MKRLDPWLRSIAVPGDARSTQAVVRLVIALVVTVGLFSAGFLGVMRWEGQDHTVVAAVYWTLVTMSTLGYGDIVFTSDVGRLYSLVVMMAGAVLILVVLPFTFIQLVYLPWREAARKAQAPRSLPADTAGHLLLTGDTGVDEVLIRRATTAGVPYAILVQDVDRAVALREQGHHVMVGGLDDPETYRLARAERAALIFSARGDYANCNVAFTVREVTNRPQLIVTADDPDAVDVLELAGADHVVQLGNLLGTALARRMLSPGRGCQVIGTFDEIAVAEMVAAGSGLEGRTLAQIDVRREHGVSVVGVWDRGTLVHPRPDLTLTDLSIVVLAGPQQAVRDYGAWLRDQAEHNGHSAATDGHVIIVGGGRVGRALAQALAEAGRDACIIEKDPSRRRDEFTYVMGDATDRQVLESAGISDASAVAVTTHDDDVNVLLTLYLRRLRSDALVLGRVAHSRNLSTMYRAGADFVLSYASTGASEVWNRLRSESTLLLTDDLVAFRASMPARLAGQRLSTVDLRASTGCTVVAVVTDDGPRHPDPHTPLPRDARLVMIGPEEGQTRFARHFERRQRPSWLRRRSTPD